MTKDQVGNAPSEISTIILYLIFFIDLTMIVDLISEVISIRSLSRKVGIFLVGKEGRSSFVVSYFNLFQLFLFAQVDWLLNWLLKGLVFDLWRYPLRIAFSALRVNFVSELIVVFNEILKLFQFNRRAISQAVDLDRWVNLMILTDLVLELDFLMKLADTISPWQSFLDNNNLMMKN